MRSDFPVVLDACVLVGARLCDLYLRLAENPRLYTPVWSEAILDEVFNYQTTKLKNKLPQERAQSWRAAVTKAFPEASVQGWEALLPAMTINEKDKHVLAAAIKSRASVIVSFNLKDFPSEALKPFGVEAIHPQDYLLTLWSMAPSLVMAKLGAISRDRKCELQDTLIHLGKTVPAFSRQILEEIGEDGSVLMDC